MDYMKSLSVVEILAKNKTIKSIFKALFKEEQRGKMGISIAELSEKTGIERHRLVGILDVLVVLGILIVFEIGMAKAFAPSPLLMQLKHHLLNA
jgi:DNA-binding IclR family transcriptional regulator